MKPLKGLFIWQPLYYNSLINTPLKHNYMNDLIETIEYRGYKIDVFYDTNAQSPDDWGNENAFIVYDHRDFCVERKGFDPSDIFESMQENPKKKTYEGYWFFPLYAYIHSGVSLSLGRNSYPFTCNWDTSFSGFVLVKREKGWTYTKSKAESVAQYIVNEWNMYLRGDVYGYNSEVGGCWGFYGEEGMEQMIQEAKGEIDYHIKEENKKSTLTTY